MKPLHPTLSPDFPQTYFGKYIHDLYSLFIEQGDEVHEAWGLKCPTIASSTLHYISLNEPTSVTQVASAFGQAHQLTAHRVEKLIKLGIVERRPDPNDGRRFELILTDYGKTQAKLLEEMLSDADAVYSALCEEIGVDLPTALTHAFLALQRKPLLNRFGDRRIVNQTAKNAPNEH